MQRTAYFQLLFCLFLLSCQPQSAEQAQQDNNTATTATHHKLEGKTMGTTWHITYVGKADPNHQRALDSLLIRLNEEVSTYIPSSVISQFNQSEKGLALNVEQMAHFIRNFKAAQQVYKESEGHFDPTVMPLVNYWGFGYTGRNQVKEADQKKVKELLAFVGMNKVQLTNQSFLAKDRPEVELDFSALAKGYGVDELCRYFDGQGISDYFVEIGGEVSTKGKNPKGELWTVGISRPETASAPDEFYATIQIDNSAIATSGNYRNVYTVDGVRYFHTIDPFTGFPKGDRLLSTSIITDDCMMADAYATAFMAMGLDKAMAFARSRPALGVFLIYTTADGKITHYTSPNMEAYVRLVAY
jgi:thiamine biosynthesis lipoprotein